MSVLDADRDVVFLHSCIFVVFIQAAYYLIV